MVVDLLKGLALCAVFMAAAMIAAIAFNTWFGLDVEVVWFIFGCAYADTARRFKL